MARSVDKKKPGSSLFEYGDNPVQFYDNAVMRNNIMKHNLSNYNSNEYEKVGFRRTSNKVMK